MGIALPQEIIVGNYPGSRQSLRIAFVTETYAPEVNGAAMSMARVVEGLHRRHHDLQLIRPRQGDGDGAECSPRLDQVLTRGVPIPRYPNLRAGLPARQLLVRMWSAQRPDVVHVATEGPLCWSALQAARRLGLPVSSDFRTNFHAYSRHYGIGWLHRPIRAYLRHFHNRTQCTMVPTESLRRELSSCGFRNLSVVSRGVDTRAFSPAHRSEALRAGWGAGPDDLVVACVGRVAAEKNLETLIAAFEAIRRIDARARVVIVGDGPLRAELQARHPAVCFAGQRSGGDLAAHYASADLFLFPSLTETFGNVTAEAMASGLPVLAFDYAAASQLIRSTEGGVLVPFADTQAFVRHAIELAGNRMGLRAMGHRAREAAAKLDWEGVVARFEAVLAGLVGNGSAPAATTRASAVHSGG